MNHGYVTVAGVIVAVTDWAISLNFVWWGSGINNANRSKDFSYTVTPVLSTGPLDLRLQHVLDHPVL